MELQTDEGKEILRSIRTIRQRIEPEVVATEDAEKARKLKAATRAYRARGVGALYGRCLRSTDLFPASSYKLAWVAI